MTDKELQFNDGTGQLGKIEKKEQTLVVSPPAKHPGRWIVDKAIKLAGLDVYKDYSVRGTEIRSASDLILKLEAENKQLKIAEFEKGENEDTNG